jgi:pyruvate kinase
MRRTRHTKIVATLGPRERRPHHDPLAVRGVHPVHAQHGVNDVPSMVETACVLARNEGYAAAGELIVIAAGMPFGTAGTTNLLHIARV